MEDKFKDVNNCRNYLKIMDEITDLIEMLPNIDDASMDFYDEIYKLIVIEDERINKKLKRLEKESDKNV